VSELAQVGVASILIPYPYAVDDHQTRNAQFLSKNDAAILLPQTALSVETLVHLMKELYNNPDRLQAMSAAARNCATPTALQEVVDSVISY
ncbi:MAG: UDP-N-acetylglucosamine--N-acetylmuramyl-(pentapeptide) pyrophosphoryl-undecaprenol N-acetylglucosamine transferase, partial [Gammaproteobacteria bacterium]